MKNQIIRGICRDITSEGYGVVDHNGFILFVKEMLIGEEADIRILSIRKKYGFGKIEKLCKESKERVSSECPVSYKCGGCDLRHMRYMAQLDFKERSVRSSLKKANLSLGVLPIIGAEMNNYYRNKVQVPVKNGIYGYYRKASNDIVEEKNCLLQSERANNLLARTMELLKENKLDHHLRHLYYREGQKTHQQMLGFIVKEDISSSLVDIVNILCREFKEIVSVMESIHPKDDNVILGEKDLVLYGQDYIEDEFDGLFFRISFRSFFQIHSSQAAKLYKVIKEMGEISKQDRVLDLYCGIGSISLYLARYAKHVTGVEIVKEAIENAKVNAERNGIANAVFYCDDAKNNLKKYLKDKDVLIVDPPRKGLSNELIDYLLRNPIKKIVYVSCGLASFVRDLTSLQEKYTISDIQPVDMFPNTVHIECVALLVKA